MIVSRRQKFVFLHCRKTAGTSIAVALSKHLGPDDIQIGAWRETRAAGVPFNRQFWRDIATPMGGARLAKTLALRGKVETKDLSVIHKAGYRRLFGIDPPHARAEQVKKRWPKVWEQSFKFCFVRNPYEQAVSSWLFQVRRTGQKYSFSQYLTWADWEEETWLMPSPVSNWQIYTIGDKVVVDFVGRYERLAEDMAEVYRAIGLPSEPLPEAKRADRYDYRDYYTENDKRLASRVFEKEIDTFGYAF